MKKGRKSTKSISYNYDATGYLIQLCDGGEIIDEYRAGNNPHDSTASLPVGDKDALPLKEIAKLARTEAKRLAKEHGVPLSAIEIDEDIVVTEGSDLPKFYECGICSCYHPADWDGDCRDDSNRFTDDQLEAKHGPLGIGWDLVDMPGVEDPKPSRFLPQTARKGRKR